MSTHKFIKKKLKTQSKPNFVQNYYILMRYLSITFIKSFKLKLIFYLTIIRLSNINLIDLEATQFRMYNCNSSVFQKICPYLILHLQLKKYFENLKKFNFAIQIFFGNNKGHLLRKR